MSNGIPNLLNPVSNITNIASLLISDSILIKNLFIKRPPIARMKFTPRKRASEIQSVAPPANVTTDWGIYTSSEDSPVLTPDSILSLDYKKDWNIPKYPMELGAFQSYNKVVMPYDVKVRMTFMGPNNYRAAVVAALDEVCGSLDLYHIVTPDVVYIDANIFHYEYRRTSTSGVGMLIVDVSLAEIRQTIAPAWGKVKVPASANPIAAQVKPKPVR